MKKLNTILTIAIIVLAVSIGFRLSGFLGSAHDGKLDGFAQCLTDKGVKMYGAYWCPHCQNQKTLFGDSWDFVNYIECSLPNRAGTTEVCLAAGIKAFPTWEIKFDDRTEGELTLKQLSEKSGCALP